METAETAIKQIDQLRAEPRINVPTKVAADYLGLKLQTLHGWACYGGPIKPRKIGGRLMWPMADILKLVGVED